MSATIGGNALVAQSATFNAIMPPEGPACVHVVLDFTTAGNVLVDFTLPMQQHYITAIQSLIVRNWLNANPVTVTVQGTAYTFDIPGNADAVLQVLASNRAKFTFTTVSGVRVPVEFVNVPMSPIVVYNSAGGGMPVSGTVTALEGTNPWIVEMENVTGANPATFTVAVGGTAVTPFAAATLIGGGIIVNPYTATESLFVDPVNAAGTAAPGANGTTIELKAGDSYTLPRKYQNAVSVNAATGGHTFTAIRF